VTVMNGGSAALPITSIALAGTNRGQFEQTNTCGNSLPRGSSCTISVKFAPTSAGSKAATLNVTAAGTTQKATLGGTGM
jgi:Abnormal spindle-like microcephaly-assoc'd, ASPM-SPD-2-Hydin